MNGNLKSYILQLIKEKQSVQQIMTILIQRGFSGFAVAELLSQELGVEVTYKGSGCFTLTSTK